MSLEPDFRCEGDRTIAAELLQNPIVLDAMRERRENPTAGVRRQLLANALRLTVGMAPRLHEVLDELVERLGITISVEIYVYSSASFNAACLAPENDRLLILVSSSLLERFQTPELKFVLGHELGHHVFGHTAIPIGLLVDGEDPVGPRLAMKLFSWSRYAEISADRAGAICCQDGDAAARSLFKLASGLTTDLVEIRIDDFAAQVDEMILDQENPGRNETNEEDWFLTHPFSPLRVKALQLFFQSAYMQEDGISVPRLEAETHALMEVMSPTYLQEKSEAAEAMRRVLFAAGCVLMAVSGGVSEKEIEAFENLFGKGSYTEDLDLQRLAETVEARIARVNEVVPQARRIHIIRDLCLIAVATGRVTRKEREYIHHVGKLLKLSPTTVEHYLSRRSDLD